jgi:hypothetical protein
MIVHFAAEFAPHTVHIGWPLRNHRSQFIDTRNERRATGI